MQISFWDTFLYAGFVFVIPLHKGSEPQRIWKTWKATAGYGAKPCSIVPAFNATKVLLQYWIIVITGVTGNGAVYAMRFHLVGGASPLHRGVDHRANLSGSSPLYCGSCAAQRFSPAQYRGKTGDVHRHTFRRYFSKFTGSLLGAGHWLVL